MRTRWLSGRRTPVPQRDRAAKSTAVKTESHGDPMHIPSDRVLRPRQSRENVPRGIAGEVDVLAAKRRKGIVYRERLSADA